VNRTLSRVIITAALGIVLPASALVLDVNIDEIVVGTLIPQVQKDTTFGARTNNSGSLAMSAATGRASLSSWARRISPMITIPEATFGRGHYRG